MKRTICLFSLVLYLSQITAQVDADALFVLPSVSSVEMTTVTTPKEGSLVYNQDDKMMYEYDGSSWVPINRGDETKVVADDNIVITGSGTTADPYRIRSVPATLTENADGTYTFSNGVDPDVTITFAYIGNVPIVSQSSATGGCSNKFEPNETRDVIIQGDYFDGSASVTIVGQTVNSVTVNSINQITANVTSGATTGDFDIQVTTNAGTGTLTNGFSVKTALVTNVFAAGDITLSNQMSYTGGVLDRVVSAGWNQQGYSTVHSIPAGGEGHLNFVSGPSNRYRMIGLNSDPATNASYNTIDYAIYLVANSRVYVYENGAYRGNFTTYVAGDNFEIYVACSGLVTYAKNGTVFYTSSISASGDLYFDSSFYSNNGNVSGLSISN
ncbi:hypothetical protein HN014_17060 [Aquimarina sp. TRL1]|uniref:hypothetical protein n=1 Tax=Aquimarina sp. (strain TRL1) TaxID=2736252 RepID=UPI001588BFC3|nr:hypothetical protein [Aquimarina sp. TRL1]QKX06549.1 hypothetical protein HN014_17060 [Aquimarina sp. TRL1]